MPRNATGTLFDLGSGVGVVGLAVASQNPKLKVVLVEKDKTLRNFTEQSLQLKVNQRFAKNISVLNADVLAKGEHRHRTGLKSQIADYVVINPPFYNESEVSHSPSGSRVEAHILDETGLEPWIKTATDILVFGGELTIIFRADGLNDVLTSMDGRFGAITILPIFSREGMPAKRIIVRGIRGSRAPTEIRRGLVTHGSTGNEYKAAVETILRKGVSLNLDTI